MISPKKVAHQFNTNLLIAGNTDYPMPERVQALISAYNYYYVLTGVSTSLPLDPNTYDYSIFYFDESGFSTLEVNNTDGTRYKSPIRRFLSNFFRM